MLYLHEGRYFSWEMYREFDENAVPYVKNIC